MGRYTFHRVAEHEVLGCHRHRLRSSWQRLGRVNHRLGAAHAAAAIDASVEPAKKPARNLQETCKKKNGGGRSHEQSVAVISERSQ